MALQMSALKTLVAAKEVALVAAKEVADQVMGQYCIQLHQRLTI
jgi:hypothetical protein